MNINTLDNRASPSTETTLKFDSLNKKKQLLIDLIHDAERYRKADRRDKEELLTKYTEYDDPIMRSTFEHFKGWSAMQLRAAGAILKGDNVALATTPIGSLEILRNLADRVTCALPAATGGGLAWTAIPGQTGNGIHLLGAAAAGVVVQALTQFAAAGDFTNPMDISIGANQVTKLEKFLTEYAKALPDILTTSSKEEKMMRALEARLDAMLELRSGSIASEEARINLRSNVES